jgi:hypothetical protein
VHRLFQCEDETEREQHGNEAKAKKLLESHAAHESLRLTETLCGVLRLTGTDVRVEGLRMTGRATRIQHPGLGSRLAEKRSAAKCNHGC